MILYINMARILNRLRQKGGDIPKGSRVKRLQPVESKWNVRSGPCGNQSSGTKTHAEPPHAQCKAFLFGQVWNEVHKGELQIELVLLHRRRRIGLAGNDPGDTLDEKPYSFA